MERNIVAHHARFPTPTIKKPFGRPLLEERCEFQSHLPKDNDFLMPLDYGLEIYELDDTDFMIPREESPELEEEVKRKEIESRDAPPPAMVRSCECMTSLDHGLDIPTPIELSDYERAASPELAPEEVTNWIKILILRLAKTKINLIFSNGFVMSFKIKF